MTYRKFRTRVSRTNILLHNITSATYTWTNGGTGKVHTRGEKKIEIFVEKKNRRTTRAHTVRVYTSRARAQCPCAY